MKKLKKQKPKRKINIPASGPQSGAGHEAGVQHVLDAAKSAAERKAAAGPGVEIKTKSPYVTEITPGKKKDPADRKKEPKDEKDLLADHSFDIPVGRLIKELTLWLAKKNKKWEASKDEIGEIEEGFNKWLELRLPQLEKLEPEMYLLVPVVAYLMRRV
jgi:hypothetical protein